MSKNGNSNGSDYRLRVIDLFCGAGGLTLGAARAGFNVVAAVDNDSRSIRAHKANFHGSIQIVTDIASQDGSSLLRRAGLTAAAVDGLVGGPPCQGFSRIGRRNPGDTRNELFGHFFRFVAEIRPKFYLVENVLGILDDQFDEMRRSALEKVDDYHNLPPMRLRASDFGAATSRERVFFIGQLKDHMRLLKGEDFEAPKQVREINVQAALKGLRRRICPTWQSEEAGWRTLTCQLTGAFGKSVLSNIPQGTGNPIAVRRLRRENLVSGCLGTRHTAAVIERFSKLDEGEVDKPSRSVRLQRTGFCPTIRSGTGPEHGSYQALRPIHPTEPRVITPREAARLQGFPDWFLFDPTKWHSFRQIGNSVSPLLVQRIMKVLLNSMKA